MGFRRRYAAGLLTLVVAAGLNVGLPAPASGGPATRGPAGGAPAARPVTLITGDRVTLLGPGQVSIQRGTGREHVTFLTRHVGGHTSVIPADAVPAVRAGQLDIRLFDVTALLEYGYHDGRADLPLIVTQPAVARGKSAARVASPAGARVVLDLPGVRGVAARVERKDTAALWRDLKARGVGPNVPALWLDAKHRLALDLSVPAIGAPAAWQSGYTGAGVTVAVVDSGIDATHPDLAGKVVAQRVFGEGEDNLDHVGHGTHVASTIAGSAGGGHSGVAPGVRLVDAKACGAATCTESAMIAAMHWAVAEQQAKIVNMSLGGPDTPAVSPMEQAVQDLTEQHGALFVISAGNTGAEGSINSPGSADAALTVGAVDDQGRLARFSSRGPRAGDSALKPDITAPGVEIVAARSKDSAEGHPGDRYLTNSGTSMAAPHVAGAAAILAQRRPGWGPAELKSALMGTATPDPAGAVLGQGAGRVDIPRAIGGTVLASPPSLSFGRPAWPHHDDPPTVRTVGYRNAGTAPVTLNLALATTGADGQPAPTGLFTLSAPSLTIPAGGRAEVRVTADTRITTPDGFAGGYLAASAGDGASATVIRTPLGVVIEPESYDLTLEHLNRAGQPTGMAYTALVNLDTSADYQVNIGPDGTATTRVPKGRYLLQSTVFDGDPADPAGIRSTLLLQPVVEMTGARRIAMDARTARPLSVTVPRRSARQIHAEVFYGFRVPAGQFVHGMVADTFDSMFLGAIGGDVRLDGLVTKVGGQWAEPGADGTVDGSPYTYNLAWAERGRALTGFRREVRNRELAEVRTRYRSHLPNGIGVKYAVSHVGTDIPFGGSAETRFRTPFTRTEYFTTGDSPHWNTRFGERDPGDPDADVAAYRAAAARSTYRPRPYQETWNHAVFGPALPGGYDVSQAGWVVRQGDLISALVPMFGDGSGRAGASIGTGRVRLLRDGALVGETDRPDEPADFEVPAGPGRYRLEVAVDRGAAFTVSTSVTAAWEFESRSAEALAALPLSVVRFTPRLDERHTAPAGRPFLVPVTVQAQAGAAPGRNRSLTVEVSYDDGRAWRATPIQRGRDGALAMLWHPREAGFVSLRAKATDTAGNTVEQTILRAYRIG